MDWEGSVEASELYKFAIGALMAATAFYLKRTVSLLDKVEDKLDAHGERLTKLETRSELQTSRV